MRCVHSRLSWSGEGGEAFFLVARSGISILGLDFEAQPSCQNSRIWSKKDPAGEAPEQFLLVSVLCAQWTQVVCGGKGSVFPSVPTGRLGSEAPF